MAHDGLPAPTISVSLRNPIGIMQGRLLPEVDGKIQAFPAARWREEFSLASQAGLDCIEWIYEVVEAGISPLASDTGIAEIQRLGDNSAIAVCSICADFYMTNRLVSREGSPIASNVENLKWLLGRAARLGASHVVLPFVDSSSLTTPAERSALIAILQEVLPIAERAAVELHLETDWPPGELGLLREGLSHELLRMNYDIGNSAALGYDPSEELPLIAPWLGSVHVKDRVRGGETVPLGSGDADFPTCFRLLREATFSGPLILQAARDESLDEVDLAVQNRLFVEQLLGHENQGL